MTSRRSLHLVLCRRTLHRDGLRNFSKEELGVFPSLRACMTTCTSPHCKGGARIFSKSHGLYNYRGRARYFCKSQSLCIGQSPEFFHVSESIYKGESSKFVQVPEVMYRPEIEMSKSRGHFFEYDATGGYPIVTSSTGGGGRV